MEPAGAGSPLTAERLGSSQIAEDRGQVSWASQCDSGERAAAGNDSSELGRRARVRRGSHGRLPIGGRYGRGK